LFDDALISLTLMPARKKVYSSAILICSSSNEHADSFPSCKICAMNSSGKVLQLRRFDVVSVARPWQTRNLF